MEYGEERGRCIVCGNVLPYGRSDMKFCSVRCKSRYHYCNGGQFRALRLRIIKAIDRNHRILDTLLDEGIRSIDLPELGQLGYDFNCITSYHKVGGRNEYRCYDIKYYMTASRIFNLEKTCERRRIRLLSDPPPSD
ncbi:MAG: hypothetical protein GX125_09985 [Bacteroidales bacterium]|jgi:predicted nucleic acid-binding Zn ribbon protein|nr:hypothetical protein [Bacteroidota bacterium]NLO00574.1 hypothetical protein [Bacteroidales bacterium]